MHAVFISSDAEVHVDPRVCVTCAGHFLDIILLQWSENGGLNAEHQTFVCFMNYNVSSPLTQYVCSVSTLFDFLNVI